MKLSDYVADFIAHLGTRHVFLVTGGAVVHIVDSIGKHKTLKYVCVQHEQAGAMAAEAYSRLGPGIGVAVVTSGPGATNLITGICCAWFDSIPMLCISGQVNLSEQKGTSGVRQLGFQETEIVDIVRPITKFSAMVTDPTTIRYFLEKAVYEALSGRQGPVLLDIPLNVQHAEIDPNTLKGFTPPSSSTVSQPDKLRDAAAQTLGFLMHAQRPVLLAGGGIKYARAEREFLKLVDMLGIPVVCSWSGFDIMGHEHPLFVGQMGIYGNRGANFLIQNAHVLLAIGTRLDTRQVTANPESFARAAKKIVVDLDATELNKGRVFADLSIQTDAKVFIEELFRAAVSFSKPRIDAWLARAEDWKNKYPACTPEFEAQKELVNPYYFIKVLSEALSKDDIIIPDEGGNLVWTMQAFRLKQGQRLFSAYGNSPMGYALPASMGAYFATGKPRIICIDGDGGLQMNIQEFQTLVHYNIPVKMFILNNGCYGIIRQFQDVYFQGSHEASVSEKGYSAPDFMKVASAYGIATRQILSHANMQTIIQEVLTMPGPVLCDVVIKEDQKLIPKLEAVRTSDGRYISKPIEDQWPYLPREEFKKNMIIDPLDTRVD